MQYKSFQKWLVKTAKLGPKSACDAASRLKRAGKHIDLSRPLNRETLSCKLSRDKDFMKLSIWVQAQLKRAVLLFWKFNAK